MRTHSSSSLKTIAREAGLAEGTVSRIIKGTDQCSEATRARVMKIATKHKYRPNMLVRGMQTGRTKNVGVMLPMYQEYFGNILSGIHRELAANDHVPIVLWSYGEMMESIDQQEDAELQQIFRLLDRRVDGIILWPTDDRMSDKHYKEILDRKLPLITVDRELDDAHADFVGIDDEAMGRIAAEHLLELGHRDVGHIAGPDFVTTGRRRRRGFERAIQTAGGRCQTVVDPHFGKAHDAARDLLTRATRPSAIFAASDILGAQLYQVAAELNLSIPRDLSVIGGGNLSIGPLLSPEITTVGQEPADIGKTAAHLLMTRLEEKPAPAPQHWEKKRVFMKPELIVRRSTAPFRVHI